MNLLSFKEFIGESLDNLEYANFDEFNKANYRDIFEKIAKELKTEKFLEMSDNSQGKSQIIFEFLTDNIYELLTPIALAH